MIEKPVTRNILLFTKTGACGSRAVIFIPVNYKYSGDPKSGRVRISNGRPDFEWSTLVQFSNGLVFEWLRIALSILNIIFLFYTVNGLG